MLFAFRVARLCIVGCHEDVGCSPGFYPLDAKSTPPPSCDNQKHPQAFPKSPDRESLGLGLLGPRVAVEFWGPTAHGLSHSFLTGVAPTPLPQHLKSEPVTVLLCWYKASQDKSEWKQTDFFLIELCNKKSSGVTI